MADYIVTIEGDRIVKATELVRCRDCSFPEATQPGMVYCPLLVGNWISDDFFCKAGERRTDE